MGIVWLKPSEDLPGQVYEISLFLNKKLPHIKQYTRQPYNITEKFTQRKIQKDLVVEAFDISVCRAIKAGLRAYFNKLASNNDLFIWKNLGSDFKKFLTENDNVRTNSQQQNDELFAFMRQEEMRLMKALADWCAFVDTTIKLVEKRADLVAMIPTTLEDNRGKSGSLQIEKNPLSYLSDRISTLPTYHTFTTPIQEARIRQDRRVKTTVAILSIAAFAATAYYECTKSDMSIESAIWKGAIALVFACALFYMVNKFYNTDWHEFRANRMCEANIDIALDKELSVKRTHAYPS